MVAAGATRRLATGARCGGEMGIEMDPNENLRRQREILAELRELADRDGDTPRDLLDEEERDLLVELSALSEDLDEWMSKGGFAPEAWQRGPDVAARQVDPLTVGVTIGGVDVYVRDTPGSVIVSVGTDELPPGKTAMVESFDGVSWEHELP
jgi:hypothetical protein